MTPATAGPGAPRAFRFSLQLSAATDGRHWAASVRRAAAEGYAMVSLPDHLGGQFAPLPALAAAAGASETVRLGMFVLANDFRHPAILAKEAATLDVLSAGRVELGLGAGWNSAEYASVGLPFDRPATRLARLAESVSILKALFAGGPVTFDGRFYQLRDLTLEPLPLQRPSIPLMIGGGGERILRLAAREADTVSIATNMTGRTGAGLSGPQLRPESLGRQIGWIADEAGGRLASLELNLRVLAVAVGSDRVSAAASLAATAGCEPADLLDSPFALIGTEDEIVGQLERTRHEFGISFFTVSQRHAPALVGVVRRLGISARPG